MGLLTTTHLGTHTEEGEEGSSCISIFVKAATEGSLMTLVMFQGACVGANLLFFFFFCSSILPESEKTVCCVSIFMFLTASSKEVYTCATDGLEC